MKAMESSYLILRNVDFVAKYFPYFLQTSIRGKFKLEISYPKSLNFVSNNMVARKSQIPTAEEREMFRMLSDPPSPRILETVSSIYTENMTSQIEGRLL